MAEHQNPQRAVTPHIVVASPMCALCHEPMGLHEVNRVVPVVTRTAPLFVRGEAWCAGCSTLNYGVSMFRHARLRKEDR